MLESIGGSNSCEVIFFWCVGYKWDLYVECEVYFDLVVIKFLFFDYFFVWFIEIKGKKLKKKIIIVYSCWLIYVFFFIRILFSGLMKFLIN